MQSPNKWLAPPRKLDNPKFNLFTLPYAGGGASIYYGWTQPLADQSIQLYPIQLPGRENRLGEAPISDYRVLVNQITDGIQDELNTPYALFGHSMGAALAYELTCELAQRDLPLPKHLFVSGRNAPHVPWPLENMDNLSDDAFIQKISKLFGNISEAVLKEPELLEIITPILRADFNILDGYQHLEKPQLACPITVFNGTDDEWTDLESTQSWNRYTQAKFSYQSMEGSHFFINTKTQAVIDIIARAMHETVAPNDSFVTYEF